MRLLLHGLTLAAFLVCSTSICAQQPTIITPIEAVVRAAEAATTKERVVHGVFEMVVRGTGRQDSMSYLNSEADYRDQRALTLAIPPHVQASLQELYGPDILTALKGKRLRVRGTAQRVTIWFYSNGRRTEKYYFQTHIDIHRADQITVIGDG
jgi:hypothetical protein